MKQKLRYRFGEEEQQEKFHLELRYLRRKTTETLQELATGVEKLVQLAYPGGDPGLLDILAQDGFIDALEDEKLQKEVRRQRPTSLQLALTKAMRLEVLERGTRRSRESPRPRQVSNHQRDWDVRLPYIMAAYRASRHVSTKFTPNMLVLARENRAPADLVSGTVKGEEERYDSYNDYVYELQSRFRSAHQLAREHLETAAERRKE